MQPSRWRGARSSAGQWVVLAALAAVAFVLGFAGLRAYVTEHDLRYGVIDLLYIDLRLFSLGSLPGEPPWPWTLETARFLAAGVGCFSALKALAAVYRDRADALRRSMARDHVVVIGTGDKGRLAADTLAGAGNRVVVVDKDAAAPALRALRSRSVLSAVGDARDDRTLQLARVDHARAVVVLCGADATNAAVVSRVMEVASGGRRTLCLTEVSDPELSQLLRLQELAAPADAGVELDFFDLLDAAAHLLAQDSPGTGAVAIVGDGPLAERLVTALRVRHHAAEGATPVGPLRVTVIGPTATGAVLAYEQTHPPTSSDYLLEGIEADTDQAAAVLLSPGGRPDVGRVYVCCAEDTETLTAALALHQQLPPHIAITAGFARPGGLAALAAHIAGHDRERLEAIAVLDPLTSPEFLRPPTVELLARAIHTSYRAARERDGGRGPDDVARAPWEDLPEGLRESNRSQARAILDQLRRVGAVVVPDRNVTIRTGAGAPSYDFAFTAEEVEVLAEREHARWRHQREDAGWRPGPRDHEARTTPYLVDWEELPDDVREYDREAVRALPRVLASAGFRIVRAPSPAPAVDRAARGWAA